MQYVIEIFRKIETYAKAIIAAVGSFLTAVTALSEELGLTFIDQQVKMPLTFFFVALTTFATWAVTNYEIEIKE